MRISRSPQPVESEVEPISLSGVDTARCVAREGADLRVRLPSFSYVFIQLWSFAVIGASVWLSSLWLPSAMPVRNKVSGVSGLAIFSIYAAVNIVVLSREFAINGASVVMTRFRLFSRRRALSSLVDLHVEWPSCVNHSLPSLPGRVSKSVGFGQPKPTPPLAPGSQSVPEQTENALNAQRISASARNLAGNLRIAPPGASRREC